MQERIQKIIAAHGIMSRRAAEQAITQGRVTLNGNPVKLGDTAQEGTDTIELDGNPIRPKPQFVYIMLNKPRGVVTTMADEKDRKTVAQLVVSVGERVLPVGRLDMQSEGLLLMTNDSEMINALTHPSRQIEKEYHVWVKHDASDFNDVIQRLCLPIEIEGYVTKTASARIIESGKNTAVISVVIHEGRKRQVRLMCANVGLTVLRLLRYREDELTLGNLKPGTWRHLTEQEIKKIKGNSSD